MASVGTGSGDSPASAGIDNSSSSGAANASKPLSSSFADTCSCRVSTAPRSCYECINIALRSGTKCAVAPNGDCVDEAKAIQLYQSQANVQLNSSITIYSSVNSTYCERADAVCSQCRATWYQELLQGVSANSSTASPRMCVGTDGCVSLAFCEAFQSSNRTCVAPSENTATTAPATVRPTQMGSSQTGNPLGNCAWLIILFALFVVAGIWSYQQTQVDENGLIQTSYRQHFRGKKRVPPRGPSLSLSGWLGYREKLIEEERAAMSEGKTTLKKTLTENGPDLAVQVGEGYRPASPSHAPRQQQHLISIFGM